MLLKELFRRHTRLPLRVAVRLGVCRHEGSHGPHIVEIGQYDLETGVAAGLRLVLVEEVLGLDVGEHEEGELHLQVRHNLQHLVTQIEAYRHEQLGPQLLIERSCVLLHAETRALGLLIEVPSEPGHLRHLSSARPPD